MYLLIIFFVVFLIVQLLRICVKPPLFEKFPSIDDLIKLRESGFIDFKIFRVRQNHYIKGQLHTKLVELGEFNDIVIPSIAFNTVEDIKIQIIGFTKKDKAILVHECNYNLENKALALSLKYEINKKIKSK